MPPLQPSHMAPLQAKDVLDTPSAEILPPHLDTVLRDGRPLQVFLTPEYLAIAMEYATDGDMFQLVVRQRGLLEKDARWYFQQLIVAVDYCHRMVRWLQLRRRALLQAAA